MICRKSDQWYNLPKLVEMEWEEMTRLRPKEFAKAVRTPNAKKAVRKRRKEFLAGNIKRSTEERLAQIPAILALA